MNLIAVAADDLTGFILLLCMLISSRVRRSGKSFELQLFSKIAVLTMISCAVDFFAFYYDGKPGALPMFVNMAANTFCFISNPISLLPGACIAITNSIAVWIVSKKCIPTCLYRLFF